MEICDYKEYTCTVGLVRSKHKFILGGGVGVGEIQMIVHTKTNDTKLHYYCTDKNAKKYILPTGFKAYVTIDSGQITDVSITPNYLDKSHDMIRYQILGADDNNDKDVSMKDNK